MSNRYFGLKRLMQKDRSAGKRCAERLLAMRRSLGPIRKRKSEGSLLLATWNIRDFDSNKWKWGHGLPETFFTVTAALTEIDAATAPRPAPRKR